MRNQRRKRPGHSAAHHMLYTVTGSSVSEIFWLMLRNKKCGRCFFFFLMAFFFFFVNNSHLFIGCKLYTMNITQRQDIILLPTGKREGKGEKSRWREEREREKGIQRESEEALSF